MFQAPEGFEPLQAKEVQCSADQLKNKQVWLFRLPHQFEVDQLDGLEIDAAELVKDVGSLKCGGTKYKVENGNLELMQQLYPAFPASGDNAAQYKLGAKIDRCFQVVESRKSRKRKTTAH